MAPERGDTPDTALYEYFISPTTFILGIRAVKCTGIALLMSHLLLRSET
jgi:hypothetical protein